MSKIHLSDTKDFLSNIKLLRDEANNLKECFNNQCFQVIAITSTYLVFLFKFMIDTSGDNIKIHYEIGLSSFVVLILIATVLKVGIYKFESANRLIGYILFVENNNFLQGKEYYSKSFIVNWESMIRAWRIFQTTIDYEMYINFSKESEEQLNNSIKIPENKSFIYIIFIQPLKWLYYNFIFYKKNLRIVWDKGKLRSKYEDLAIYKWYSPGKLVHSNARYSPGSYLKRMMFMLHVLAILSLCLIWIAVLFGEFELSKRILLIMFAIIVTILSIIFIFRRQILLAKRIEGGLFCIHSSSIFWSVISKAHDRALIITGNEKPLKHYSFILSCLSLHFVEFGIDKAHEWCDDKVNYVIVKFIKNDLLSDYPTEQLRNQIINGLSRLKTRHSKSKYYLPSEIVSIVQSNGFPNFKINPDHTKMWKSLSAKDPNKGYGVQKGNKWFWNDLWLEKCLELCEAEGDKYKNHMI